MKLHEDASMDVVEQIDITNETCLPQAGKQIFLFQDLLDAVLEKNQDHAISKTSGTLGSGKDTDVLDLDDLEKALAARAKKQKKPVLIGNKR